MTNEIRKEIRDIIDDHPQIGYSVEVATGDTQVFQLNARNFWDLVVKDASETIIPLEELTLFPNSGQIRGVIPAGDVTFEYVHAGFTDAELDYYFAQYKTINATALKLVEILLASAAKRFDYKAGIKDIKASQVFDHLKELRLQLKDKVENEDGASFEGGIFVDRLHPAFTAPRDPHSSWRKDVSREDS